jgi:uncharacterized protein (DUF2252 family)
MAEHMTRKTIAERRDYGRNLRQAVHRVDQAVWTPHARRHDPVDVILRSNAERLPALIPIKMGRMAQSPFGFFRGAAPVMAADLAMLPKTGLRVQMCGDAHVRNLGAFAAADGHLVFDLNDFDETLPGPWEWDLKRLAASFVLAGQEAGDSKRECDDAVRDLVRSYREGMDRFAGMKVLELLRYEVRRGTRVGPVHDVLAKAERATPERTLEKLTVPTKDGGRRFADKKPLLEHLPDSTARNVLAALIPYRETLCAARQLVLDAYQPVDVAFKVVGTGSVGTRDYVVLCFGNGFDDSLFLQVKEEMPSCYSPYLPEVKPFPHEGRRVAEGQYRMQTVSDPLLGWTTIDSRHFLVRQLADHKAAIDPAELKGTALREFAAVSGEILAKAHARTGDAAAIAGYCGKSDKLDQAISKFAFSYAEQVSQDHAQFVEAVRQGRVKAISES